MRNIAHISAIAALTLAFSGGAFAINKESPAEPAATAPQAAPDAAILAPPDVSAPPESLPTGTIQPESALPKPAAAEQTPPAIPAEDVAVAEKLRDLIENRLKQHVSRERDRTGIEAFYRGRDFAPLWIGHGAALPRAREATGFLRGVGVDGLDPADYPTPAFADRDPERLATDELKLTNSVLTFARHASTGRVAFTRVSGSIYFDLKLPDSADVLAKMAAATSVRDTLDAFNPQHPAYKALKAALATSRGGDATDRKPLRDPEPKAAHKGKHAHKDKQRTESRTGRADTIIANMERWRWLPHDLGTAYVVVNVPDYTLKVVDHGKTAWSTKIVVGKPGNYATPLLTQTMKYITVNPTWNVPPSIIRNEYLPVLQRDPGALARVGLRIGRNHDGSIRIYQPPGERNALGRIRFNFPNRFLVYQHDTPDKNLFEKSTRAYSHGCMRVQNPDQYAEVLLSIAQPEEKYTAKRIRALYGTGERGITFKKPIPVYITYQTAFFDDEGRLQTRADIYGLDKEIASLLHEDRRVADVPIARNYSSGSKPVMARLPQAHRNEFASERSTWESDVRQQDQGGFPLFDRFKVW